LAPRSIVKSEKVGGESTSNKFATRKPYMEDGTPISQNQDFYAEITGIELNTSRDYKLQKT
jgi:hypothetical protein